MGLIKADRVKETTTTTGTGSFALSGAVAGYRAFSEVMATNDVCYYTAINTATNEWECGWGAFTAPSTLSRNVGYVVSSSGIGSLVNFGAGVKEVFISATSRQLFCGEYPPYSPYQVPSVYLSSGGLGTPPQIFTTRSYATVANVAIGLSPFRFAAETAGASSNVGIGTGTLNYIGSSTTVSTSSSNNIAIGSWAGSFLYSGNSNIMLGSNSLGSSLSGNQHNINNCVIIGPNTYTLGTSDTNSIVIGANAIGNGSNTTTIGHTDITDCYIAGHLHPSGAVRPASIADASAPTNAIYYSTTAGKLVYKDASGTVNNLY